MCFEWASEKKSYTPANPYFHVLWDIKGWLLHEIVYIVCAICSEPLLVRSLMETRPSTELKGIALICAQAYQSHGYIHISCRFCQVLVFITKFRTTVESHSVYTDDASIVKFFCLWAVMLPIYQICSFQKKWRKIEVP